MFSHNNRLSFTIVGIGLTLTNEKHANIAKVIAAVHKDLRDSLISKKEQRNVDFAALAMKGYAVPVEGRNDRMSRVEEEVIAQAGFADIRNLLQENPPRRRRRIHY